MRKKALITGASRGIGAETAKILAGEGYDLFLVCRKSEKEIGHVKEEVEKMGKISCQTMLCDVSDPGQVETMIEQAGDVQVLINNAGISYVGLLTDMSVDQWSQVINTNLNSLLYLKWSGVRKGRLLTCLRCGAMWVHLWRWPTAHLKGE